MNKYSYYFTTQYWIHYFFVPSQSVLNCKFSPKMSFFSSNEGIHVTQAVIPSNLGISQWYNTKLISIQKDEAQNFVQSVDSKRHPTPRPCWRSMGSHWVVWRKDIARYRKFTLIHMYLDILNKHWLCIIYYYSLDKNSMVCWKGRYLSILSSVIPPAVPIINTRTVKSLI